MCFSVTFFYVNGDTFILFYFIVIINLKILIKIINKIINNKQHH